MRFTLELDVADVGELGDVLKSLGEQFEAGWYADEDGGQPAHVYDSTGDRVLGAWFLPEVSE